MEAEQVKNVVTDQLLKESPKDDGYGSRSTKNDFVANGQIMVTITLAEYRDLVKANADQKVTEADRKVYEAHQERDARKKQVEDLQKQLDSLKCMIAGAAQVQSKIAQEKANGEIDLAE